MKHGDRIHLDGLELRAALASGMVEPHGVDSSGVTVYLLTRAGETLTGRGERNVGATAQRIQAAQPLIFGNGPTGIS
jgi:hypothetical protein